MVINMKLNNKGKVSLLELLLIILILIELIWYIANSYGWLDNHMSLGNDGLYANTALSVAKVNSLNGVECPVNECEKGNEICSHYTSQGYIGYFDGETNTIVGIKPKGYNSSSDLEIDGQSYTGEVATMVIRVTCNNGDIKLDWVKGNDD